MRGLAAARRRRRARAGTASLEVLELFPELLQLALHRDDLLGDLGVVRLGAHRVHLAPELLGQEAELLARRAGRAASASRAAATWARKRTSSSVMSSRSAWKAISWASRVSSTGRPSSSSATAAAQPVALADQPLGRPRAR